MASRSRAGYAIGYYGFGGVGPDEILNIIGDLLSIGRRGGSVTVDPLMFRETRGSVIVIGLSSRGISGAVTVSSSASGRLTVASLLIEAMSYFSRAATSIVRLGVLSGTINFSQLAASQTHGASRINLLETSIGATINLG